MVLTFLSVHTKLVCYFKNITQHNDHPNNQWVSTHMKQCHVAINMPLYFEESFIFRHNSIMLVIYDKLNFKLYLKEQKAKN